ncbi:SIR2 family NAD-dependent protein deacylase [Intestinibacter sp.]|uniref:SIR2 family NAD-dependent protein deacylase n=1 Tax=Intestinibacter sp. TaxID=1965304 RepID=UPI003F1390D5
MFLKKKIMPYTKGFSNNKLSSIKEFEEKITAAKDLIDEADAIVIGAGAGLSTSAGLTYFGDRFEKLFPEYIEKYNFTDMYSAGFYPFDSQEEKWAYWSRHIYYNRYDVKAGKPYQDLLEIMKNKNYFVLTTNVDHQFQLAGFPDEKIFATQGDYGLWQCAKKCHDKLYSNKEQVIEMVKRQKNCKIPSDLVPKCPVCGGEMENNLRCDDYFVEDEAWHRASERYSEFLLENKDKNILFLELGVGMNTPVIIKYPFWRLTLQLKNARYICINLNEAYAPEQILDKSICINYDIGQALEKIKASCPF